jgi:hypothetical protein
MRSVSRRPFIWIASLTCLVLSTILVSAVLGQSDVPLPSEIRILPPGPDVSPERAAFLGKWFGRWDGSLSHVLIVEEIVANPPRVMVVYAWGTNQVVQRPGWSRARGRFSGNDLYLDRFPNGAQVIYRMLPGESLDATYEVGSTVSRATMRRIRD